MVIVIHIEVHLVSGYFQHESVHYLRPKLAVAVPAIKYLTSISKQQPHGLSKICIDTGDLPSCTPVQNGTRAWAAAQDDWLSRQIGGLSEGGFS